MKNKCTVWLITLFAIIGITAVLTNCKNEPDPPEHVHQWGDWVQTTAPTCTTAGIETKTCSSCMEEETRTGTAAIGHNVTEWTQIKAPTCTEAGEESGTCTHIESTVTRVIPIDPTAHDYEWVVTTPATYTTAGEETEICSHDPTHTRDTRPIPQTPFTTVADLGTWLTSQPDNDKDTPYVIKLNMNNLGGGYAAEGSTGYVLKSNITKYVSLDLSDSTMTSIQSGAFDGCTSLTSITIGNRVTSIASAAFQNCSSLPSIIIPNSVTSIGNGAFWYCTSLTSVTIPDRVTSIGTHAFYNCTSLTSVTFERAGTTFSSSSSTPSFIDATNSTSLQNAYTAGGIGTYTRPDTTSSTWTKQE